jgi:uncharacterized protein with NRDE domain
LILGGRDELGGGTWLGCTRDGKLAFLTNVREPGTLVGAKSRGELPVRFLQVTIPTFSAVLAMVCVKKLTDAMRRVEQDHVTG